MPKSKTRYVCSQCGCVSSRWLGKCPQCGEWNTMKEEVQVAEPTKGPGARRHISASSRPESLPSIAMERMSRQQTGMVELDRVLGGGIVPGALILLSGDPGIGKSTLVLQIAAAVSKDGRTVLYASGEESAGQIKLRAQRLGIRGDSVLVMAEISLDKILAEAEREKLDLLVVDSIQTMYSSEIEGAQGSVSQIREGTARLMEFAKTSGIPVVVIGHVTKDGSIAGPRMMEHMVDVVLYFEGDRHYHFRVLRSMKNRFGSTNETGLFNMTEQGLAELANPSQVLLAERASDQAGSSVVAVMDGLRPLLGEVQALTTRSVFAVPRRTTVGMDYNRLIILLAVLEKRVGLSLGTQDVYINVVGGLRLTETAADLPVALAVISSYKDMAIDAQTVIVGEVGLTGDIRMVPQVQRRVKEAAQMGFRRFIIPKGNVKDVPAKDMPDCTVIGVATLKEAIQAAFKS